MTPRPRRPLSANFTQLTLTKALASRPAPARHKESLARPLTRHASRFALVIGGTLLAGSATLAAVSAGPAVLSKLTNPQPVTTKTDPQTSRTTYNFTDKACPNVGSAYQLKNSGHLTAEEGAKYVQASCERLLAQNALQALFPNNFTKYAAGPQKQVEKSVSAQYDGRGWNLQFATYHSGNGHAYATVDPGLDLPLPAGAPLLALSGTTIPTAELHDGDALLLALHNAAQDYVSAFTMTAGQRLIDVAAMRSFIEQSTIKAAAKLSLPVQYYSDESLSQWQDLIPCQDDTATSCGRDIGPQG